MTTAPESMPTLSTGAHRPGEGEACLMEYVSLLAGESWSDRPDCTHPVLASAARTVNDHLSDADRHLLVPLIGRLFGTAEFGSALERKRLSVRLALWCADQVADLVRDEDRVACDRARAAARLWVESPTEENAHAAAYAAAYAAALAAHAAADADADADADAAAYALAAAPAAALAAHAAADADAAYASAKRQVAMLTGLIDEYDRLTGRADHRTLNADDYATLTQAVSA